MKGRYVYDHGSPYETVLHDAEQALAAICGRPKGAVYASRKGIVAGAESVIQGYKVVFRRVGTHVRLERWTPSRKDEWALPPDLERRAAEMLDSL